MPVEHLRLAFKPLGFFKMNPSMDVPGVKDSHSVAAFVEQRQNGCCSDA